jgi:putative copper resistance protein D
VVAGLVVSAALYLRGLQLLRRRAGPHAMPRWHLAAFLGGLAVIAFALLSPLDYWADIKFSLHMVQHELLAMVAAPLLLLGAPVTLALRVAPVRVARRRLVPILHSWPVRRLTAPPVAALLFTAVLWAMHLSSLHELALRDDRVHAAEHLVLLCSACLLWWPVLGVDPNPKPMSHPGKLLYLFLLMPISALLGLTIYSSGHVLYAEYADAAVAHHFSALADQQLAGGIMGEGDLVILVVAMAFVLLDWLDTDQQSTLRAEGRLARERSAGAETAEEASREPA